MQYSTRRIVVIFMGLVLTSGILFVQFSNSSLLSDLPQRLKLLSFDLRMKTIQSFANDRRAKIVIVDIDEDSLGEHGRWPWSRAKMAQLVEHLYGWGAAVVAFDIMFAEPESNPATEIANSLVKQDDSRRGLAQEIFGLAADFDYDSRFAEVLTNKEVILGYAFHPDAPYHIGSLPQPLVVSNSWQITKSSLKNMLGYTANLPLLTEASRSAGFFSLIPDIDGVMRRAPIVNCYNNQFYGSLALEVVRNYLFVESVTIHTNPINNIETLESIELDGFASIPTDGQGQMIVPYLGPQGTFPYISARYVLAQSVSPDQIKGSIVLVGTTAPGIFDLRSTPVQAAYPGVEIHANLINAILNKHFLVQPAWALGADFAVTLAIGVILSLTLPFLAPLSQLFLSILVTGSLVFININFWQQGLVLSLAMPIILITILSSCNLGYGFLVESRSRRLLTRMFGQYVPAQIVQQMSDNPNQYSFDGETRELTVLFADIRGFTTLSESLSAGDLKKLLNRYFTPMTQIIFETRGTIDKYVGDQIMAFWGAPVEESEHAVQAIEAGLRMLAETTQLQKVFAAENLPRIAIGIGMNSGLMNVGDMGSKFRRAYTVIGDAVNLGARLEGMTKYYSIGMVVSESTKDKADDNFIFRELDLVQVKGKTSAVRIYEPICRATEINAEINQELADYHAALADFRSRKWEAARSSFCRLREAFPEQQLYKIYLDRINTLADADPGENWDGVYTRTEK